MSSHKKNTLEAKLERHRISNLQMIAKKLLMLVAGYEGNFNFVDGSPSIFWIHQESPGLSQLQNYLRACYGDKVGDGGGERLAIGSQVLAKYSVDQLYYRARVQEVVLQDPAPGESMYSVCYVDYGNSEVVSGLELMTWDTRLDLLPEQAAACCLEDAPRLWREGWRATWTPEQLEAFQRTMRRGQLKVTLRRQLRHDKDPRKPRFEALVGLEGESLLQILKRQSVFADDLTSWEPGNRDFESDMAELAIGKLVMPPRGKSIGEMSLTPRLPHPTAPVLLAKNKSGLLKLEPGDRGGMRDVSGGGSLRGIPGDAGIPLINPDTGGGGLRGIPGDAGIPLMSPGTGGGGLRGIPDTGGGGLRGTPDTGGGGLRGIPGDAGISLISTGTGGAATVKQESPSERKVSQSSASVPIATPEPISIVQDQGTNPDNDTEAPGSPVPSHLLKKSKELVECWFNNNYQNNTSPETIPSLRVDKRNYAKAPSECNSDVVNFA